ncbi:MULTISPECIES: tyrosine recombinase XerC [unclassified Gluconobacter]|uniref:site-specific integrase n=1 Tax=unclassified Gluconobacter TaxID=2644261 RepID=UPI001C03F13D|nr:MULTISPECIES: site-specific integrase [unclassified Gluconobacter]
MAKGRLGCLGRWAAGGKKGRNASSSIANEPYGSLFKVIILRLKYIQKVKDRYGKYRLYFRRAGHQAIRLPDQNDTKFFQAYQEALQATETIKRPPAPKTLAYLIDLWICSARFKALGENTQVNYRRLLLAMQKASYADDYVEHFQVTHLRRFVAEFSDRPAAANHRIKLFRMLFDHAVDEGWRPDNPAVTLKRYKEKADGAESWSDEQIRQYEAYWKSGSVQRRALALLLYTGQRRSDVVRMGHAQVRGDIIEVTQQKTGTSLMIPIHPNLMTELVKGPSEGTFLQRQNGEAFTANGFYMRFKAWRDEAGLPDGLSPHGLRKAAARRLAEAGCTTHQIASITGHASLSEVQRYTRAVDQEKLAREAIQRITGSRSNKLN